MIERMKQFKLKDINTPEYRHFYLLTYWILYLIVFQGLERYNAAEYTILHCKLDDYIPFCEFFVVPYLFWFVYIAGMTVYTLFYDRDVFVYYMKLIIITSSIACVTYFVYPNALNLRPSVFLRDNLFVDITKLIYSFDTSTNVCPSIHVSSSVATLLASKRAINLNFPKWKWFFSVSTVLICISTVFMKQHSAIDVFWGVVTCLLADAIITLTKKIKENNYRVKLAKQ